MSYKTIIAYLARPDCVTNVLSVALPLAERHEAHLLGLHVFTGVPVTGTIGAQLPLEVIEQYAESMRVDAKEIEKAFKERVKSSTVESQWHHVEEKDMQSSVLSDISEHVRCADIIVMGQHDAEARVGELTADIIMAAGRPVLVVPDEAMPDVLDGDMAVAWDGSRESARAAFDALPLLKRAKAVHIVSVQRKGKDDAITLGGGVLAMSLARHGVKAEAGVVTSTEPVGETLMKFAKEKNCGLLVMGCYGHSRLKESLFGGATQGILQNMPMPVLMSH